MTITKVVPAFSYSASKTVLVRSYFRRPSTGTLAWPSAPSASSPGSSSSLTRSSSWPPTSPRRSRSRSSNSLPSAAPFKQLLIVPSSFTSPAASFPQRLHFPNCFSSPTATFSQLLLFPSCFSILLLPPYNGSSPQRFSSQLSNSSTASSTAASATAAPSFPTAAQLLFVLRNVSLCKNRSYIVLQTCLKN